MKKLYYLLMALPLLMLSACDDENDLPDVDVLVNIEGATRVNDILYVVQGDVLDISSITIEDHTKKGAVIGSATYYWDYYNLGGTIVQPYGMEIPTSGLPLGNHLLQIEMSIYAVDYPPCIGFVSYKVVIVKSSDDIPTKGDTEQNPIVKANIKSADDED